MTIDPLTAKYSVDVHRCPGCGEPIKTHGQIGAQGGLRIAMCIWCTCLYWFDLNMVTLATFEEVAAIMKSEGGENIRYHQYIQRRGVQWFVTDEQQHKFGFQLQELIGKFERRMGV